MLLRIRLLCLSSLSLYLVLVPFVEAFLQHHHAGPVTFMEYRTRSAPTSLWVSTNLPSDAHLKIPYVEPVYAAGSIPENLVVRSRKGYTPTKGQFLDVKGFMSDELMDVVSKKAFPLHLKFRNRRDRSKEDFVAQGGVVRYGQDNVLVTARHNVATFEQEDDLYDFWAMEADVVFIPDDFDDNDRALPSEADTYTFRTGCVPWMCKDFAKSIPLRRTWELPNDSIFDWVPGDFELKPGMKVGMAVMRQKTPRLTWNATAAYKWPAIPWANTILDILSELVDWEDPELVQIYGKPKTTCFLTGEIKNATDDGLFFEHDINTYQGCSGAIIFLLDRGNEGRVDPSNFGKAIGVHCGGIDSNANGAFCPK